MVKRGVRRIKQKRPLRHRLKGFLSFTQFTRVLRKKKIKDEFNFKLPKKIRDSSEFIPLVELKEEMEHKLIKPKRKSAVKKKAVKRKAVKKRKTVKRKAVKKKAVKRRVSKKNNTAKAIAKVLKDVYSK